MDGWMDVPTLSLNFLSALYAALLKKKKERHKLCYSDRMLNLPNSVWLQTCTSPIASGCRLALLSLPVHLLLQTIFELFKKTV